MEHPERSELSEIKDSWHHKAASAAAAYVYHAFEADTNMPPILQGYTRLIDLREDEGSIRGVTLYDATSKTAIVSLRGTASSKDWVANMGIGCSIGHAIHADSLVIDGHPVRLPEYFGRLATDKLQGLFGNNMDQDKVRSLMNDLSTLNWPLSQCIDLCVSAPYTCNTLLNAWVDTVKHITVGITAGGAMGMVTGTVVPGVGNMAGGLIGGGMGLFYGCGRGIYNAGATIVDGIHCRDPVYERQKHLKAFEEMACLDVIDCYLAAASDFTQKSIKQVLAEEGDSRPTIIITGHSLGRFLAGYSFLEYAGGQTVSDNDFCIDGLAGFKTIAFNGPAGFQGLPHLPFMKESTRKENIARALNVLKRNGGRGMDHVHRANDLVGHLGYQLEQAHHYVMPDVIRQQGDSWAAHFIRNHGIEAIMEDLHKNPDA